MSESLLQFPVPQLQCALADLSGQEKEAFRHCILSAQQTATVGGVDSIWLFRPKQDSCLIVLGIDIKTLQDPAAAQFSTAGLASNDWRSSFDLNPFGPWIAGSQVALVQITVNGVGIFPQAVDIGVINAGVLFVFNHNMDVSINVQGNLPAGADIEWVIRVIGFTAPIDVYKCLKKFQTQIISAPGSGVIP